MQGDHHEQNAKTKNENGTDLLEAAVAEAAAEAVVVVVVVVAASFRLNSLPRSHGTRLSEQQQGKARCEGEEVESNEKLCLPFVSFPFFFVERS